MFKPVPETLKVSGQARAFVFPVCDHSEDDLLLVYLESLSVERVFVEKTIVVEDLLTVRHSCWSIVGAFADVVSGLSSTLAPLLLTVASEISILCWVVVSTGCCAFKVMTFSTWFWLCLEMFVAMDFFFNSEASRVLVLLVYPDRRPVLVSFGCPLKPPVV
ncbi:hypothetical protein Bca4012_052742 [Brassica carinata]